MLLAHTQRHKAPVIYLNKPTYTQLVDALLQYKLSSEELINKLKEVRNGNEQIIARLKSQG